MFYYIVETLFRLVRQRKEGLCKGGKVGQEDEEKGRRKRKKRKEGRLKG